MANTPELNLPLLAAAQAVATLVDLVAKAQHRDHLHGLPLLVADALSPSTPIADIGAPAQA